jgi:hypothetical protein
MRSTAGIKMLIKANLGCALLIFLLPGAAQASPTTWKLNNFVFADGGQASGFVVYDNSSGNVINWEISVTGGDEAAFPRANYLNLNSFVFEAPSSNTVGEFIFRSNNPQSCPAVCPVSPAFRDIRITPAQVLTGPLGTVITLDPTAENFECYNCVPSRIIGAGASLEAVEPRTLDIPTLSPAALAILFCAIALLGSRISRG